MIGKGDIYTEVAQLRHIYSLISRDCLKKEDNLRMLNEVITNIENLIKKEKNNA